MPNLRVKTSFNTILSLESDTVSKRILAFVIDFITIILYIFAVNYILRKFNINLEDSFGEDADRVGWGFYSLLFLPVMFYTLISETLSGGYTIGKRIVGIKVVKIDGFQPTFVEFFIRWIFRMVDIYMFIIIAIVFGDTLGRIFSIYTLGIIGLISMIRSKKGQRLGDMIAGTAVIKSKLQQNINITILKELAADYKPKYSQVLKLSDNDARIIKETYENAVRMGDHNLVTKLVIKLEEVMGIKHKGDKSVFIEDVLKDFNYYTQNM